MKKQMTYIDGVHHYGKIWGWIACGVILAFPFVVALLFGVFPDWGGLGKGLLGVAPIFWTVGLIEVFTYVPMLGAGSSYLGFVTGNLSNLKVPCALTCMEEANVKPATEEGEIISTISTAVSSIVTMLIIAVGVCLLAPFGDFLQSEWLAPAFDNILPALFGALGVVYISKNWKVGIVPIILMLILFIAIPALDASLVGIMVPVGAIVAILAARIMYKKGWLGEKENIVPVATATELPVSEDETNKEEE